MAGFDRSKLKATSANVIQKQEKDFKRGGGNLEFLSIETGDNVVRIFPYHPDGGGESYAEAKSVSFLEVKVPKRGEDKKVIEGQFEIKRKPIFNSKVHGSPELREAKLDLVEAYMDIAKRIAIPNYVGDDKEQFSKIWNKVVGNALTKEQGIKPQDSWVVYASIAEGKDADNNWIWGKVGLLDLKKSVKDLLTEKAAELEMPDPYSDPDDGYIPIVTKAKQADKPSDWYKVRLDSVKEGKTSTYVTNKLTDDQINEWAELKPLHELYVNSFKKKDLEYQVEGLKRFDDKLAADGFPILVFQYDEFLDLIEKIDALMPLDTPATEEKQSKQEASKKEEPKKPAVQKAASPVKRVAAQTKVEETAKEEAEIEVGTEAVPKHISGVNDKLSEIRRRMGK